MTILPLFLLIIFSLFVFYSIRVMIKRGHDLHALAFFTLYIYTIFGQIGYAYFPEFSIFNGAYFGPGLFYKFWAFMFLSFIFTFFLYKKMNAKNDKTNVYSVRPASIKYGEYIFFLIVILLYLALAMYFVKYRGLFAYGGGTPMGGPWFGIGFWMFTLVNFILFTLFRDKLNKIKKRIFSLILFLICFELFLRVVIASGTRSPIFYFFIAIVFYELFPLARSIKFHKRKIFVIIGLGFLVINMLTILRTLRTQGDEINFSSFYSYESSDSEFTVAQQGIAGAILLQDWYLPPHTLYISMHYKIIDPIEVFKSNFFNSMVKFKYPFLTATIVERVSGSLSAERSNDDRGAGWSYQYFIEGYNAIGLLGVFYNALFWNLGITLWIRLTQSNNRGHNKAMLSIAALILVLVMRTQTSAFIQFYWLILLPGLGLLLLANNSTIAFFNRKKSPN